MTIKLIEIFINKKKKKQWYKYTFLININEKEVKKVNNRIVEKKNVK